MSTIPSQKDCTKVDISEAREITMHLDSNEPIANNGPPLIPSISIEGPEDDKDSKENKELTTKNIVGEILSYLCIFSDQLLALIFETTYDYFPEIAVRY